jgi:glycosyltransferase involved in cell wall biosynthesis
VVAADEVGLPEVVRPPWGTLVAPGDDEALAGAIAQALARPVEARAEAGRAGRAFVLEHASLRRETAKLSSFIRLTRTGGPEEPPVPSASVFV